MGHTKDFGGGITVRANGDKPGRRVHKQYVDVYARTNADGTTVPVRVCWPDGRGFTIDQIIRIDPFGAVIHDAQTAVYTVRFGGWTTQLMLEHYHRDDPIHGADDRLRWWVWAFENTRSKNDVSAPPADTRVRRTRVGSSCGTQRVTSARAKLRSTRSGSSSPRGAHRMPRAVRSPRS